MKKVLFILCLVLFSCNDSDDCMSEINAINKRYDDLIEQVRETTPVDQVQIDLFEIAREDALEDLDC